MSKTKLNQLLELVIDELTDQVKNGVAVVDKEGEVVKQSTPAAVLNVARQLLKDLSIETTGDNDAVKGLIQSLPFDDRPGKTTH